MTIKKKVAICMRGSVTQKSEHFNYDIYSNTNYIDYSKCYNSIKRHIIEANSENYEFDIFCHSWAFQLKDELTALYKPKLALFEDNRLYNDDINRYLKNNDKNDFNGISQAITIKKSIELKETYEKLNNISYDYVILYRYDVLLWKDMILTNYNLENNIYANGYPSSDFHFIMNNNNSYQFKSIYESLNNGNPHIVHFWIMNYVQKYMNINIEGDDIMPGQHQEVFRKIQEYSINKGYITIDSINTYS